MSLTSSVEELNVGDATAEAMDSAFVQAEKTYPPLQNGNKRNPPARNTSRFWFERFLAVIQRQNPSVIDVSFLSQIAPSNEGKLLAQLKFLRVVDEQGKPTPLLPLLNLVGEEQKMGFQQMIKVSYPELLNEVKLDRAVADDLVNYFIRKHAFTREKAVYASKFFLFVAEKASLQLSAELSSFYSEKSSNSNGNSSPSSLPQIHASSASLPKAIERATRPSKERAAAYLKSSGQSRVTFEDPFLERTLQPAFHATIEIRLDKDTPKEYWDRVLALLGEKKAHQEDQQGQASSSTETIPQLNPP